MIHAVLFSGQVLSYSGPESSFLDWIRGQFTTDGTVHLFPLEPSIYRVWFEPFEHMTVWDLMNISSENLNQPIIVDISDVPLLTPQCLHYEIVKFQRKHELLSIQCYDRFNIDEYPYWMDFENALTISQITYAFIRVVCQLDCLIHRFHFSDGRSVPFDRIQAHFI
jgi:hypothetical protein